MLILANSLLYRYLALLFVLDYCGWPVDSEYGSNMIDGNNLRRLTEFHWNKLSRLLAFDIFSVEGNEYACLISAGWKYPKSAT